MSSNKLTDAEARQLLEMTKKSLVQEINFPTRGNEKEFDVVGDTKKDVFAIKIYRGKIQPFKYNIGARIKRMEQCCWSFISARLMFITTLMARKFVVAIGIYTQKNMDAIMLFQQKMSKKMLL